MAVVLEDSTAAAQSRSGVAASDAASAYTSSTSDDKHGISGIQLEAAPTPAGVAGVEHAEARLLPRKAKFGKYRYVVLALGFLANVISYTDRSNLSLAVVPMEEELHYFDASVQGVALAAFYVGYMCSQVLGGYLAFRRGAKSVLIFSTALWSVATLVTPAAARASLGALVCARIVLGLGEGLCLPSLHALASAWVPASERATAASLMTSGQFGGTMVEMHSIA